MKRPDIYSIVAEQFAPKYDLADLLAGVYQEASRQDFSPKTIRSLWQKALREEKEGVVPAHPRHFYIHIPFCLKKCVYCCYYTVALAKRRDLDSYLDWLSRMLDFYSKTFSRSKFQTLYFGGGTPSILTHAQLERLLRLLFDRYSFDAMGEKSFECNPASVNERQLHLLRDFGFNRISMGVQSLEAKVLSRENRGYQTREIVAKAIRAIRRSGDFILNVDLLLGMQGDEERLFMKTLVSLFGMQPNQFTIHPVFPTPAYLKIHYHGEPGAYYADLGQRYQRTEEKLTRAAVKYGYEVVKIPKGGQNAWTLMRSCGKGKAPATTISYSDISEKPFSLFGLGPTSRSRILGRLAYTQKKILLPRVEPEKPLYSGFPLSLRDEMLQFVFIKLRAARTLSKREFRGVFGRDIAAAFPQKVRGLIKSGRLADEGELLRFTDRTQKGFFSSAMRFAELADVESMLRAEIRIKVKGRVVVLVLERARAAAPYVAVSGGVGFFFKADEADSALKKVPALATILAKLFIKVRERNPGEEMPSLVARFFTEVSRSLAGLRNGGFLEDISLKPACLSQAPPPKRR